MSNNYYNDDDYNDVSSRQVIEEMSSTNSRIHNLINNLDNISKVLLISIISIITYVLSLLLQLLLQ